MATLTIKKYSNRRLYDTDESRYITLEELTDRIKRGSDVQVIDAKTNEDLTQATLVQIVLETKAARLLPVSLLARLIRMQDDALGDFFSKYVSLSLEAYLAAKSGAQAISPYVPFSTLPFTAGNALARALGALPFWGDGNSPYGAPQYPQGGYPPGYPPPGYPPPGYPPQPAVPPTPPPPPPQEKPTPAPAPAEASDVAALRSELEALKRELLGGAKRGRAAKTK
ncbi:MAG: polyhydroxyalkanoate synthesis regulator DNA-binding domain-containing protein [Polyangiaceae bacterium]